MNILEVGEPVTILDILIDKDRRAELQNRLVLENKTWTIIGAKLNIPGPIKNNLAIEEFFKRELINFEGNTPFLLTLKEDWLEKKTGPEYFYLAMDKPINVEKYCIKFEQTSQAAKLFDLDVHYFEKGQMKDLSHNQLGISGRSCFICESPAKERARTRKHSVEQLREEVSKLINQDTDF